MNLIKEPNLNFSLSLNLKINPAGTTDASGDYHAVAKYIASMKDLWLAPLIKLGDQEILQVFKDVYDKSNKDQAINQLHDFIIEETKINLTKIIKDYPEHLKEGIPTTMTIFGGFTNAVSIHLALAKILIEKLEEKNELHHLKKAISSLSHCSSQFAKLQANTLKLIENMNGVISNQETAYDFNRENFFFDTELRLLPTDTFLNQVIEKANDPQTSIESFNYKDDHMTAYVEKKNFSETYTRPRGCPIHASKSDDNYLLDEFLDIVTAILTKLTSPS